MKIENSKLKIKSITNKYGLIIIIAGLFILTRFFGLGQIYHQDEYRWASIANPFFGNFSSPHPPLAEYLYKFAGRVFGFGNLRIVPLFFSFLNLVLVYLVSLKITKNKNIALIAAGLFTVNIYSLIANLQIDIDGAILPFFILLTYYAYLHTLEDGKTKKRWLVLLGLAVVGGFLTKLSFLLFIGAPIADWLLSAYYSREKIGLKIILSKAWPWLAGFVAAGAVFYYFYAIYFNGVITYAEHFKSLNFASRAYFDLVFKIFKSFVWLSPLLALPVLYGFFRKEIINRYRIWFIYLFLNLIFYLVLFDFSTLTIERYFMFLIVPSVLISAEAIFNLFKGQNIRKSAYIIAITTFVTLSFLILSLPHDVLPLNPKEAYVDKVRSLEFNFLIPFTGGSGPSGFYFSAWFILLAWIIACVSLFGVILNKHKKNLFLAVFIVLGVGYNLIFSTEYLSGAVYGSVDKVAKETIEYVNSSNSVDKVITYYDIGAYYLRLSGKYYSRFYTAPKRDYTPKIESYRGQYMIIDFPAIDKNGRYWPLISRCPVIKKFQDKKIESYVFDCSKI